MLLEAHEKHITFKISKSAKLSIEVTSCYPDPTDVTPTQQGQNNHSPDVWSQTGSLRLARNAIGARCYA